jgi:hypothetical protein
VDDASSRQCSGFDDYLGNSGVKCRQSKTVMLFFHVKVFSTIILLLKIQPSRELAAK